MSDDDLVDGPSLEQPFWTHARQQDKTPPCQAQCPNSGDIRGWLGLIAQHDKLGLSLEQAYDRAWEKLVQLNPFPATIIATPMAITPIMSVTKIVAHRPHRCPVDVVGYPVGVISPG